MWLEWFLTRNGYPTTMLDAAVGGEGRELVERFGGDVPNCR